MDTPFFNDLCPPFNIVSPAAVTLSTTDKALYLPANVKPMGNPYWWPGKMVRIEVMGAFTSAATPGNLTLSLYWGTGADANGTILAASAAQAWTASQATKCWKAWFDVECRLIGASGALLAIGAFKADEASIAPELLMPTAGPAAVTVDTTTSGNVLSVQAKRSGSTAETMQCHSVKLFALN